MLQKYSHSMGNPYIDPNDILSHLSYNTSWWTDKSINTLALWSDYVNALIRVNYTKTVLKYIHCFLKYQIKYFCYQFFCDE